MYWRQRIPASFIKAESTQLPEIRLPLVICFENILPLIYLFEKI